MSKPGSSSQRVTKKVFSKIVGDKLSNIPRETLKLLETENFSYKIIKGEERDKLVLDIIKKIDAHDFLPRGKRKWVQGWREILKNFKKNKYDLRFLTPQYIKPGTQMRIFDEYVQPQSDDFELNWYKAFRFWFFKKYLFKVDNIYEFGCGTGYNLIILNSLFPDKKLIGLDWVPESKTIVDQIAKTYKINTKGIIFDMLNPDKNLSIESNSAVITLGGLEQLADNYNNFLDYLIKNKPKICLHMEPLLDFYDENKLFDYLALRFHLSRNYLGQFVKSLEKLETEGRIEIIAKKKTIGSKFHDGYSYIVWRPK